MVVRRGKHAYNKFKVRLCLLIVSVSEEMMMMIMIIGTILLLSYCPLPASSSFPIFVSPVLTHVTVVVVLFVFVVYCPWMMISSRKPTSHDTPLLLLLPLKNRYSCRLWKKKKTPVITA